MARLASQAIAGYYPTPPHLVRSFASTFALAPARRLYAQHIFFDPCAGDGAAVVDLAAAALDYDPTDAARSCYAIELETSRAARLRRRIPTDQAFHGDALHFSASGSATVLYLNPPYDTDRELGRLEHRFLLRFTKFLMPTGVLLYVVPHYALEPSAAHLATAFRDVHIWRFPDADFAAFRQVLLVATRAHEAPFPDPAVRDRILAAAAEPSHLPVLDQPLEEPVLTAPMADSGMRLQPGTVDLEHLLAQARPFSVQPQAFGLDVDASRLLGAPMPVALPARPAHIALALSAGLLNGRHLRPNDPTRFPTILAKGTMRRDFLTVERRTDKEGRPLGEVQIQQPRLDIHVLRLDTLQFHQLALGAEPTGAQRLEDCTTADLLVEYSQALADLVRQQLPPLHDPANPEHQLQLGARARTPFRCQEASIQAGLKLLALGENPQLLAEVGTGKSTVALSIARHLAPAELANTRRELERLGFSGTRLRPLHRLLIVCPPHLLQGWTDQAAACWPGARVQVVQTPSDLDREATIYILSRETAKLGPEIAGVAGERCPACSLPLEPLTAKTRAETRATCSTPVPLAAGTLGELARALALRVYRYLPLEGRHRWLPLLFEHPAAHRSAARLEQPHDPPTLDLSDLEAQLCAAFAERYPKADTWKPDFFAPLDAAVALARARGSFTQLRAFADRLFELRDCALADQVLEHIQASPATTPEARRQALAQALSDLLDHVVWEPRDGCGEPLYAMRPQPRRFPLARYILRRKARFFDLLILDEVHEFSTSGSAQQKAAHRLVELPGVPTLALTGSLMGGFASSLFANSWALSPRFRRTFDRDDKAAFVTRYGYRKIFVGAAAAENARRQRAFGSVTDREADPSANEIKQLGEAPGVLPLFILEHLLPTGLIMHKADLDQELPPCSEEPCAIAPPENDLLAHKLLSEFKRLRSILLSQIQEDGGTERAGALFGALCELPHYLDLAAEDCGPFELRYPEELGGDVVATGQPFPVRWRSPKEQWLLQTLRAELAAGRKAMVFLRNTGNAGFVRRILRLLTEEFAETFAVLDPQRVPTATRERWLNANVIQPGRRVLLVHPKAVQTGLNNLTAFSTAVWYQGPDPDARVTRQANGRPHRIGQTLPVRLLYPFYSDTLQKAALDHVARKITASLQVDGLTLAGALEAAGASSQTDREHAAAALSFGQALYEAALRETR